MAGNRYPVETEADARFGFRWGPMRVRRLATFPRPNGECHALGVDAGKVNLTIYVSPTGRSVRVYRDGKELR